MHKQLPLLLLLMISSIVLGQRFISPIQFEFSKLNFKKTEAYINYDVNKSAALYGRTDSLSIATLRKYSWEAFFNLLNAEDTTLIKQVSQQDSNILKYQSMWSSYYHIKNNGITYTYGNTKSISYKLIVEALIEDEDFF